MLYLMDRRRIPPVVPEPPGENEYLLGKFNPEEILARAEREPYRDTFAYIGNIAEKAAQADIRAGVKNEAHRARMTLALAMSWWLTGSEAHREKCVEGLDAAGIGAWSSWCSAPEAVIEYLQAFDLLRPSGGPGIKPEEHFIERLGEKISGGVAVNTELPQNNWRLCTLSAIGMTALAFCNLDTPWPARDWLEIAADGVSRMLHALISPDGAYLEGPGYSRRSSVAFIPFACAYTARTGFDLLNFPPVAKWMKWIVEISMPDGNIPLIDDSRAENLHPFPLLVNNRNEQAPLYRWKADMQEGWDEPWRIPALLLYDDSIAPAPPQSPPSDVLEESGYARFRSDWTQDAACAVLVSRPMPPLGPGQADSAHRHDDPTNFHIFANGELLTLEGGYGGYMHPERYSWFLESEAHNMILVDGLGPTRRTSYRGDGKSPNVCTAHGRVRKLCLEKDMAAAMAETSYRDVDIARMMFFARGRYFVILDTLDSAAKHTYFWTLHGAGELSEHSAEHALWTTQRSRLDVRWIYPHHLEVSSHRGQHCLRHREGEQHDYVKAMASGKRVFYLTVILPGALDDAAPEIAPISLKSPLVGVTVRRGAGEAEHFIFDPWWTGIEANLPDGSAGNLEDGWAAFIEEQGEIRRVDPS